MGLRWKTWRLKHRSSMGEIKGQRPDAGWVRERVDRIKAPALLPQEGGTVRPDERFCGSQRFRASGRGVHAGIHRESRASIPCLKPSITRCHDQVTERQSARPPSTSRFPRPLRHTKEASACRPEKSAPGHEEFCLGGLVFPLSVARKPDSTLV